MHVNEYLVVRRSGHADTIVRGDIELSDVVEEAKAAGDTIIVARLQWLEDDELDDLLEYLL